MAHIALKVLQQPHIENILISYNILSNIVYLVGTEKRSGNRCANRRLNELIGVSVPVQSNGKYVLESRMM